MCPPPVSPLYSAVPVLAISFHLNDVLWDRQDLLGQVVFVAPIRALLNRYPFFQVRVHCLVCLGKILEHLDKYAVQDEILPLLPQIPSREAATLMAILGEDCDIIMHVCPAPTVL